MKHLWIIEDPQDPDAIDRLSRPKVRAEKPEGYSAPLGEGTYLRDCDCGQRFYTDEPFSNICPLCDAAEAARMPNSTEPELRYDRDPAGRGRYRL